MSKEVWCIEYNVLFEAVADALDNVDDRVLTLDDMQGVLNSAFNEHKEKVETKNPATAADVVVSGRTHH